MKTKADLKELTVLILLIIALLVFIAVRKSEGFMVPNGEVWGIGLDAYAFKNGKTYRYDGEVFKRIPCRCDFEQLLCICAKYCLGKLTVKQTALLKEDTWRISSTSLHAYFVPEKCGIMFNSTRIAFPLSVWLIGFTDDYPDDMFVDRVEVTPVLPFENR